MFLALGRGRDGARGGEPFRQGCDRQTDTPLLESFVSSCTCECCECTTRTRTLNRVGVAFFMPVKDRPRLTLLVQRKCHSERASPSAWSPPGDLLLLRHLDTVLPPPPGTFFRNFRVPRCGKKSHKIYTRY